MPCTRFRRPLWFVTALLAGLTMGWLSEGLAYINGGDEKSTLNASITRLEKDGRGLALVSISYNRYGTTQVPLSEKEQQAREEQVRVSVATTLKSLPAGTFSEEQQRAILQAARTEFTRWMNQKDPAEFQSELKQLMGDRDFRVGVFSFQKWYEYKERGRSRTSPTRDYYVGYISYSLPKTAPEKAVSANPVGTDTKQK